MTTLYDRDGDMYYYKKDNDIYAKGEHMNGIHGDGHGYLNFTIRSDTKILLLSNCSTGGDTTFGRSSIPYVMYNKIGGNIVSSDKSCSLYIDSKSFSDFQGKFLGEWKFIKVYPVDKYTPNNIETLLDDPDVIVYA